MIINPNQFDPGLTGLTGLGPMAGLDSQALSRLAGPEGMTPGNALGPAAGGGGAAQVLGALISLLAGLMGGGANANANANNGSSNNGASGTNGVSGSNSSPAPNNSSTSSSGPVNTSVGNLPPGLAPHAKDFEDAGRQYGIDPKFLAAISMVETGDGTSSAFKNKNNAMGISSSSGPTQQGSVRDSIFKMAKTLSDPNGPYKGKKSIDEIGAVYAPVGASNDPNGTNGGWASMVKKKLAQLGGNPNQIMGSSQTMYA